MRASAHGFRNELPLSTSVWVWYYSPTKSQGPGAQATRQGERNKEGTAHRQAVRLHDSRSSGQLLRGYCLATPNAVVERVRACLKVNFVSRLPKKIDHLDLIEYLDSDRHNSNTTNVARSLDYLEHKMVHNMHSDGVCASDRVPKKS
jgi:hypothetical protein